MGRYRVVLTIALIFAALHGPAAGAQTLPPDAAVALRTPFDGPARQAFLAPSSEVALEKIGAFGSGTCAVPATETAAQTALAYDAFDARGGALGWRALNGAGCTDAAVALLTAYAAANDARLTGEQRRELAFHIAQALAFAGREDEAVAYFEHADGVGASAEWRAYVAATLAFLRHDAAALAAAREAYAAIAPGSMRLRIIDGFVACPQDAYMKAAHCRM